MLDRLKKHPGLNVLADILTLNVIAFFIWGALAGGSAFHSGYCEGEAASCYLFNRGTYTKVSPFTFQLKAIYERVTFVTLPIFMGLKIFQRYEPKKKLSLYSFGVVVIWIVLFLFFVWQPALFSFF